MAAKDDPVGTRRLVLAERAGDADPAAPDTDILVLDASFTPQPGGRPDLIPVRPALARVLDRLNLFERSTDILDRWAAATAAPERYRIGDTTWWFRVRLTARWPIHEIMLWHAVLGELGLRGRYTSIEVPADRPAIIVAARLAGRAREGSGGIDVVAVERQGQPDVPDRDGSAFSPARRAASDMAARLWTTFRRVARGAQRFITGAPPPPTKQQLLLERQLEVERRLRVLDERLEVLRSQPSAVLVVATAGFFQLVRAGDGDRFVDPHLAPIADRVAEQGVPVVTLGLQLDHRRTADWRLIEAQPTLVPQSLLSTRWGQPEDAALAAPDIDEFLAGDDTVVEIDGEDFGPIIRSTLASEYGSAYLASQARTALRAERFMADLAPKVMVLDHEGGRTAYVVGAHRNGIPIVAVQHGVICDGNAEYSHPLDDRLVRPDVTCVYGPFEQDVLTGTCGFSPESVVVCGSSRAQPILAAAPISAKERAAVRHELGVRDGDRMLVVSLAHNPVAGDLHTVEMIARTLGGALPGVHVVLKLHPQEQSESRYAATLANLAAAGGYKPPPMTVIRDFDLYRLLRAADAHLGQYSTILTDAVVAGIPNMIAVGYAWSDLLGYVDAGVAVAVRTVEDVRAFMRDPKPADPEARAAFLDAHFQSGDATGRIVDVLLGRVSTADRGIEDRHRNPVEPHPA